MSEIVLWYDTIENGMIKNNLGNICPELETFFKKHIVLPQLLIQHNVDFTINTTSHGDEYFFKKYSNLKNFYPIEIGWYSGLSPTEKLPIGSAWFFKKIDPGVEILVWFPSEGFSINRNSESLNKLFNIIHRNFPNNKIRFIFGDFYKPKNIPNYVNYKCFKNYFWYNTITNIKQLKLDIDKKSQCDFITLNRRFRLSRFMIFNDLKNSGMLDNAFYTNLFLLEDNRHNFDAITFLDLFRKLYTTDRDDLFFNKICTNEFINDLTNMNIVSNAVPPDIKLTDLDLTDVSYLELVNETNFDSLNNLFITEKTFRAIALGHIFLICGQPKTLKHLKRNGFQTFDDLFDESYDNLTSFSERWEIIKKNLQLWISMSDNDKKAYYTKSFDKLVHNQNLLYNRSFKTEIEELFEDTI